MTQVNNTKTIRVALTLLLLSLAGCTLPSHPPVQKNTVPTETPVKKECSGQKGKIYLIASSSQYDEKVIPEIEEAFSRLCYALISVILTRSRPGLVTSTGKFAHRCAQ